MAWKRPTVDTPFHIDWDWWAANDRNYRVYLYEQLCEECRNRFQNLLDTEEVDWVDPETAEVIRADALIMCLRTRCLEDPEYINESLPVAAAAFRVFIMNGNQPLSPTQLHERLPWRTADTILRVIGGRAVHYGMRVV
ncbi:MAG: hypothetical protein J5I90_06020 [Caldilineales bacterium]|nr:hypothetical protein [Caldilineales bacterium]